MLLDLLSIVSATWLAYRYIGGAWISPSDSDVALGLTCSLLLLLAFVVVGVYAGKYQTRPTGAIARIVLMSLLAWAVANRAVIDMQVDQAQVTAWLDLCLIISIALMAAIRVLCGEWIRRVESKHAQARRVVVVGDAAYLERWLPRAKREAGGYAIVATWASESSPQTEHGTSGALKTLVTKAKHRDFDELWLALPMSRQEEISRYIKALQHHFIDIRLFADVQNLPLFNPTATKVAGTTFIDLVTSPRHCEDVWSKSLFDRLFALCVLLLLSPVLLAIAALVKLTSRGPVFFRQRRKGVDGREFTILKFRSMHVHREAAGRLTQASKNDKRVTPIGRFLRKTSLDELPQFINVLFGQMSVVGPRPHALEHDDFYMRLIDGYMYRYRIKPGITGWAQINGARGETAQVECMARRVALDLFYIQHWSFWLDLKIVVMTVFNGFAGRNAY
ncbi:undecaprenyl-phosphate glucose phosphotransferase [Dyella flava]|uniref:Undecaprenyl-phosphate glucose phosphotransferase n=2 Tax=Dyella flava TaxID=1920170 RepID=A0ABS2K0K0_9GAMM|nr:undecaprenyl-phosphate glucose phosphotransferase [Dyella flava]